MTFDGYSGDVMRSAPSSAGAPVSRSIRLLIAARAVNQLGAFSLAFLTVMLSSDFGASLTAAGAVSAACGLATIPSRLFGGWLAGRLGRRRTIGCGLAGCAAAQFGIAIAPDLAVAAGCAVLLGLAFELYEPPSQAILADATPPAARASVYELLITALAAGNVVAGIIAAVVGRSDLRWLFVVDAVTCLASLLIVWIALPADHKPSSLPADRPARAGGWPRPLLVMTAAGTMMALVYMLILVGLPLSLSAHGLNPASAGLLQAASALALIAARPLLRTRWLARLPGTPAFAAGYLLMGIGLAGYAAVGSLAALIAPTIAWTLGYLLLSGRAFAVVAELAPAGGSASYLAVYGLSWGVATAVAPVFATLVIEVSGPASLWAIASALCVVMAIAQPAIYRRIVNTSSMVR
ncbi:MAG TPA: MFS transporter [Streptosporangiaceae bacterium]